MAEYTNIATHSGRSKAQVVKLMMRYSYEMEISDWSPSTHHDNLVRSKT